MSAGTVKAEFARLVAEVQAVQQKLVTTPSDLRRVLALSLQLTGRLLDDYEQLRADVDRLLQREGKS